MADTPPQFASAAQNALAGMNAPTPAAAVYQAPEAAAPPTFFGKILQGALNGLAGGLRSGQENIAGAGTPGFRPNGNGLAYAEQLQQRQDAQAQEAQAQKVAGAQQQFENQRQTFQQNQQAQLQQVQATQAKLNGIGLEQQIQHADTDAQNQYYKGQQDQLQGILDGGGKEVAHLKVSAGQSMQDVGAAYLKDNPSLMHDPNTHITYSRDADGETEVHVLSGDPNAQVDASHVNSQLKSIGSDRQIAPGTSMSRHDFNRTFSEESGKMSDQHNAAKMESLRSADALRNGLTLEHQRNADEEARDAMKIHLQAKGGGSDLDPSQPLSPVLERKIDMVHRGDLSPELATKGMGVSARAANDILEARYDAKFNDPKSPDYDPHAPTFSTLTGWNKAANSDKFSSALQSAGSLLGTKDDNGKLVTQGDVTDMRNTMLHLNQKYPAVMKMDAKAAQKALEELGDPVAAEIVAKAPDIALRYARFASGGGPSSDAQFKSLAAGISANNTLEALQQKFRGLDDAAGEQLAGMRSETGSVGARRMANINDPGTHNSTSNQAVDSKNLSGAPDVPKGMKLQRNRKTGATRLVPE